MENRAVQKLGSKGGKASVGKLTPEQRKERARKAVHARKWRAIKPKAISNSSTYVAALAFDDFRGNRVRCPPVFYREHPQNGAARS